MFRVVKRDGSVVDFDLNKIVTVITKAFDATGRSYHPSIIETLALKVTSRFDEKIMDGLINVEDIQDLVEETLSLNGYWDVSKAYILYRKQREKSRNIEMAMDEYKGVVDSYLDHKTEQFIKPYSIGGLIASNSSSVTASYWLDDIYDKQVKEAHVKGDIYLHDLSMLAGENVGLSLNKMLNKGFGGVNGMAYSASARHVSTFISQLLKYIEVVQYEWAGSISINDFDTLMSRFVRKDKLSYDEVKQNIQTLIFELNVTTRWGYVAPFTCLCLNLCDDEYQEEMDMINRAIKEIMLQGDSVGNRFSYPIICYSVAGELKNRELIYEEAIFKNMINGHDNKTSSYYGYKEDNGSIGSVSVNLGRIYNKAKNVEDYYHRLDKTLKVALRALEQKKDIIIKLFNEGLYPLSRKYLDNLDDFIGVVDLIGLKELSNADFGMNTVKYISEFIKGRACLRASCSLNAAHSFAKKDKRNTTYSLALCELDDVFELLDVLSTYDEYFDGGMLAELKTNGFNLDIVNKIACNYSITYFKIDTRSKNG
ncbi:MAG: anaerobic ribonucleoside-triphosphate reductase [Erysipelotrichaceae bacterium]